VGRGQGNEGAGRGVFGDDALEGPGDEYLEKLRRWLAKYKQYPQAAIDKKEEGQVIIGFTLKRDGTVLTAWIERSSGIPLLDEAALAMMHRASPVPPIPDRYKGNELKLAMPVDYSIGFFERLFR
jgi:protein TonB